MHEVVQSYPEPVLVISGTGRILSANRLLLDALEARDAEALRLAPTCAERDDELWRLLEPFAGQRGPLAETYRLRAGAKSVVCRGEGLVVYPHADPRQRQILLRFPALPLPRCTPPAAGAADPPSATQALPAQNNGPDAEAATTLDESEERLRLALEAGHMGTWQWNAVGDRIAWSPGMAEIFGLPAEAAAGDFAMHLQRIHADDRQYVLQAMQESLERGHDFQVEYRILRPDGSVHWVEARGKWHDDAHGKPLRMIGVCQAIDQRKHLEQQLRQRLEKLSQAEQYVRSVVDHVVDGIITIDARGIIQAVNPAAERLFGFAAAELVGRNVNVLMPEPYRSAHDGYLANYLRTGEARIIGAGREVQGRRKDGAVFPMDLGVSEFFLGSQRYFTGIVRDATERRRNEQVARFLADASRSLAALVDYQSTLHVVARLAVPFFADWCMVHLANEAGVLQQLVAAHADPQRSALARELAQSCLPQSTSPVAQVFHSGQALLAEALPEEPLQASPGDDRHLQVLRALGARSYVCVPLMAREKTLGTITFLLAESNRRYARADLAVAEDLARRAGIAIENARLYGELRDADRRKDEFLAMLSHELRNPLAPIRTGLDLLTLSDIEPETVRLMQQQLQHLVRLVDDLLDVSRIMRGKIQLRRQTALLAEIVGRAVDAVEPLIRAQRHVLQVDLPAAPVWLHADGVRLTQVVSNLLNNAAKYTEPGGHIQLAARVEGRQVLLRVQDDGIGMSPELLPHIFDLFTQADRSLERSQGGLGIGLTLVRNLVEMHGGSIAAESAGEGRGSVFLVRLPLGSETAPAEAVQRPWSPAVPRRILVVDDSVAAATLLRRLLTKLADHEVELAHDGETALELARTWRPEIVFLDIGLPRINGYEVAKRLRALPGCGQALLIALTGYGSEDDHRRSQEAGFDQHLVKPPALEALRAVLADARWDAAATTE